MDSYMVNAAFIQAKEGFTETVGQRLLGLIEPTRKEEGCVRYEVYQSTENDNDWFIFETWKSKEAFDFHMQTPYVREFLAWVPEASTRDIDIRFHRVRDAGMP
ncbi:putative quinol monooxygenase [Streptomyces sp. NPDC001675]